MDRFDPRTETFTHYRHDPSDPESLGSNRVWCVFEDSRGVLWVGTDRGLDRMDPESGTFLHYRHDPNDPASLSHDSVSDIAEAQDGTLWISTYGGGLNRFRVREGTFEPFRHRPGDDGSLSSDRVWTVMVDRDGRVWVGTEEGLNVFDPATGVFHAYRADPSDPSSLSHNSVSRIYRDSRGILWVATLGGGLNRFDEERRSFSAYRYDPRSPVSLSNNTVWDIAEDEAGSLWVATQSGVDRLDPQGICFPHYHWDPLDPRSLSNNHVTAFHEDRKGTLWVGTNGGGVNRWDRVRNRFESFLMNPDDPNSLSNNDVTCIVDGPDGSLWIGTRNGLNRFEPATGKWERYVHKEDHPHSLPHGNISALLPEDSMESLWVASFGGGLYRFHPERGVLDRFSACREKAGCLATDWLTCLLKARDGTLWVGGAGGLSALDPETKTVKTLDAERVGLASDNITVLYEDRKGGIWVGTEAGLHRWMPRSRSFVKYGTRELPGPLVAGIVEDDEGRLWISTNKGLSRFDPGTGRYRNYDEGDGLQSNQFWVRAAYRTRQGELLFGGIRGFNAFFPERILDNPYKPPVVLTDLLIFNRPVRIGDASPLQQSLPFTKKIVLTHEQSVVSFRFSALNFRAPEKNRYAYKLEGLDKDWNHVDSSRRFATYAHLPPGRYVFRVKAANNDGVWNEEGTALAVEVKPAWWQTWWFRGLGAALALALFGVLYHAKLQQLEAEKRATRILTESKEQLERKVAERTAELEASNRELEAFSYSVSHDLRAPLRAIDGFSGILHRQYRDRLDDQGVEYLDHVRSAAKRMNQMIDALLALSRIARAEVSRERVNLSELARETAAMLTAQDSGREVIFRIAPDLEVEGDPVLLRVLVQNLLENAWKFTADRPRALIEFGRTDVGGKSALFVRDNGVGFDGKYADKLFRPFQRLHSRERFPGTGIGLATVQRIVERHGGTIWAEGTQGGGATFYFLL